MALTHIELHNAKFGIFVVLNFHKHSRKISCCNIDAHLLGVDEEGFCLILACITAAHSGLLTLLTGILTDSCQQNLYC